MAKKTKALVKVGNTQKEDPATKNLLILKKALAKLGKQSVKKQDLDTVTKILDLLSRIDSMERQPVTYLDAYNFLRNRRFAVDYDIQEDDLPEFEELFGGELDGKNSL